jgi:8-oxo-dGTP diphosphatase
MAHSIDQSSPERPVVQVAIVAVWRVNGPSVDLITSRRPLDTHLGGYWEFPGGKVEIGEQPADAAVREAAEEVGVDISNPVPLLTVRHRYDDRDILLHSFTAQVDPSVVPQPRQVMETRWISIDDVDSYRWPPANDEILLALKQHFATSAADRRPSSLSNRR